MSPELIAIRMRLSGGKQVAAESKAAAAGVSSVGDAATAANAKSAAAMSGMQGNLRKLGAMGSGLQRVGRSISRYVTLPVVGAGVIVGKLAVDFDKGMRNVNSIAQLPESSFKRLSQSVLDLAGPTAQAPKTLAAGLYDLVSSGFNSSESLAILGKSARAATAGLTTTEVSTTAVAAVLNAYHLPAKKAGEVSDLLFRTVDRGVITFEQLASTIGDVLPFAASLGVDLGQVGASISTMTKAGINPAETMTRIKNIMVALLKPSESLQDALKQVGAESGEALIKQRGLQGGLEAVIGTTDGTKSAVAELFPNIRGLGGVLALTGANARGAGEDLAGMRDASGATARALSQQSQSISYQWQQLKADASALAIEIAPNLLNGMRGLLRVGTRMLRVFNRLPDPLQQMLVTSLLLTAVLGPMVWLLGSAMRGIAAVGSAAIGASAWLTEFAAAVKTFGFAQALGAWAPALSFALRRVFPAAAAAAGIGDGVISATKGDFKAAGFKLGGALIGGIVGFMLGGPVGAMIGVGLGSLLGGMVAKLDWSQIIGGALGFAGGPGGMVLGAMFGDDLLGFVRGRLAPIGAAVGGFFAALPGRVASAVSVMPDAIWSGLQRVPYLLGRFVGFWVTLPIRIQMILFDLRKKAVEALIDLAPDLFDLAKRAITGLWKGVTTGVPAVIGFFRSLPGRTVSAAGALAPKLFDLGKQGVSKMWDGIKSGGGAVLDWFRKLPGRVASAVSALASRLYDIGKNAASDFARGFYDSLPGPVKKAAEGIKGAFNFGKGAVGGLIPGGAAGFTNFPGGLALVGERGPELAMLPRGTNLMPTGPTQRFLGPATSPAPIGPTRQWKGEAPFTSDLVGRFAQASGERKIVVPLYLDGKLVAESTVSHQEDAEARA